jgi:hypothetical protein
MPPASSHGGLLLPWDDPAPAIDAARELLRLPPRRHAGRGASQHTST